MTGQAAFAIKIDADRTLFSLQEKATQYFLISLMLSTLLVGLLFFWFIDRMLLKRLQSISERARQILSFDDLSIRIHEERNDEIAQLSGNINKMLERLENENIRHQEIERRLVMNEKLVATGRLAANIAHEINNPLFAISNSIAVIKRQIKNASSDIAEVLPIAEKEIKRVRKITKKLLEYGKINLETCKENDINAILDRACEVLKLSKQIKNTAIIRNKQKGELPVFCNPDSLQQVFMNLILNASEAMNGIGKIIIEVEPLANAYEIHFRDAGPGFTEGIKKRIFEPFNSSKDAKGAGLGLYISFHIIKRHGGNIVLDELHAPGSHLVVTLPMRGGLKNG
jgi:two-component system NtrC family sensor kinase